LATSFIRKRLRVVQGAVLCSLCWEPYAPSLRRIHANNNPNKPKGQGRKKLLQTIYKYYKIFFYLEKIIFIEVNQL